MKPQIKTIEILLIDTLHHSSQESKLAKIFAQVREHCADDDFLGHENLKETVFEKIYVKNVYKRKTVEGLRQDLCLDYKTLLTIRRELLYLFAKKYFSETICSSNLLLLFFKELSVKFSQRHYAA